MDGIDSFKSLYTVLRHARNGPNTAP